MSEPLPRSKPTRCGARVISVATVYSHVSNILSKLHLASRTQAALYALREGYTSLEEEI